jgi:4-aminobutyrate aminotransferase
MAATRCAARRRSRRWIWSPSGANAARIGDYFQKQLKALAGRYPVIGEVRGKGLMIGMELVKDAHRAPAGELCDALITRSFHNGLILLSCGQSTVRFMPPLTIEEADVDEAVQLLDRSLRDVLG